METNIQSIEDCEGYKKLKASIDKDIEGDKRVFRKPSEYQEKLTWAVDRAKHYAEKTGLTAPDILDSWEKLRNYWYMNYYQDANIPLIEGDSVRVFETVEDLKTSIEKPEFRCPACEGVSKDAYVCDTGLKMSDGKICDWKVGGLFGHLGKGVYVFVKSEMRGQNVFKPVSWEAK
jgi:hypothetical protein